MKTSKPSKKQNYYIEIVEVLKELHELYPTFNLGNHIATALEEYDDLWGVPDSEILYCLEKYKATLEFNDTPRETNERELQRVYQEGINLPSADELLGDYKNG